MNRSTTTSLGLAFIGAFLFFCGAGTVSAQTLYWDTNAATAGSGDAGGDWDNLLSTNWSNDSTGSSVTGAWVDGSSVVFAAGTDASIAAKAVTILGTIATPSILFDDAALFNLTGGSIDITGNSTFDTSILGATSGRSLTWTSAIVGNGNLTLAVNGDTSATGGGSDTAFRLTGANTFTGNVNITSGLVGTNSSFGDSSNSIVLNGGGLVDTNLNTAFSRNIDIQAGGGVFRTWGSTNVTWSGNITGSGQIRRTDGGTLTLSNAAGFSGTYNNQNGTTNFTGSSPYGFGLTVSGGTISLRNTVANNFSSVNLNGGTLRVLSNASALNNSPGVVNVGGNATLATESGSTALTFANNFQIAGTSVLSVDSGFANITLSGNISSTTGGSLRTASSGTTNITGNVNLSGAGSTLGVYSIGATLNLNSGATINVGSLVRNNNGGSTGININGATVTTDSVSIARIATTAHTDHLTINSGSLSTRFFNIGDGNNTAGRVTQTGGTVNVVAGGNGFRLGHWSNGATTPGSEYNLTGGTLDATGLSTNAGTSRFVNIGWDGRGLMTVGGGAGLSTLKAAGIQLDANGDSTAYASTLTVLNNGLVEIGTLGSGSASVNDLINLNGGTLSGTATSTWGAALNVAGPSTVNVNPGFTVTQSGLVTGTATGAITKTGTGVLVLSNAGNTFAGPYSVNAGTLRLGNALGLGLANVASSVTVASGAAFDYAGFGSGTQGKHAFTVSGTGVGGTGAITNSGGAIFGNSNVGSITLAGDTTVGGTGRWDIGDGNVARTFNGGGFVLTKTGANEIVFRPGNTNINLNSIVVNQGTFTFEGFSRTTGDTSGMTITVNNGTTLNSFGSLSFNMPVVFNGTNTLGNGSGTSNWTGSTTINGTTTVNSANAINLTGTMTNNGALVKAGSGTTTLGGNSNAGTGTTTVSGGTLRLDYSTNDNNKLGSGALTLSGGTIELVGGSSSFNQTVGGTSLISGVNNINRTSGTTTLDLGAITIGTGTVNFGASGIARTTNTNNLSNVLGSWATITGNNWAMNDGTGLIIAATTINVDRLGTGQVITDGSTHVRLTEGIGSSANFTLSAPTTTIATLIQSNVGGTSAATIDMAGQTLALDAVMVSPLTGTLTIGTAANNGTLKATGTSLEFTDFLTSGNSVVVNSIVADGTGASSLTKIGAGTLVLNGSNTYTGDTSIRNGSVLAGSSNSLGSGVGALQLGAGANSGRFVLNGNNQTVSGLSTSGTGTANAVVGGNAALSTLTVNTTSSSTYGGLLGGVGANENNLAFVKSGSGALTLSSAAGLTHSGATTVDGGQLTVTGALRNTAALNVNNGATLELGATNLFVGGHGIALANSRVITANSSTVLMNSSMDSRIGNVTLSNGSTWTSNRGLAAFDVLLANTDAGAATVAVTGTGTSFMNGTGGIHLQGVQNFDVADTTGNSNVDLNASMILAGPGFIGGAAGGVNKLGTGAMLVSANNTYNGTTAVSAGTLIVNGAHNGGASVGAYTVASGASLMGTGSTNAAVTIDGTLSPGNSIESFATGALTMNAGSTYVWETLDSGATGADLVVVNGALTLNGATLDLSLANLAAGTWALGDKLTLFSYTGTAITSGFTGFINDTAYTFGANEWTFKYDNVVSGRGNNYAGEAVGPNFVTFTVTAVPEPSGLMLTAAAVGGLVFRRRRQV